MSRDGSSAVPDAVWLVRTVHSTSQSDASKSRSRTCWRTNCGSAVNITAPYWSVVDVDRVVSGNVVSTHGCPESVVPHDPAGRAERNSSHAPGSQPTTRTTSPPRRRSNGNSWACVTVGPSELIHLAPCTASWMLWTINSVLVSSTSRTRMDPDVSNRFGRETPGVDPSEMIASSMYNRSVAAGSGRWLMYQDNRYAPSGATALPDTSVHTPAGSGVAGTT